MKKTNLVREKGKKSITLFNVFSCSYFTGFICRSSIRFEHFYAARSLFNSLPNDKILDWPKLRAFADDKLNAIEKLNFVLGLVENIVGKVENAGFQHFVLSHIVFKSFIFLEVLKGGIVWQCVKVSVKAI